MRCAIRNLPRTCSRSWLSRTRLRDCNLLCTISCARTGKLTACTTRSFGTLDQPAPAQSCSPDLAALFEVLPQRISTALQAKADVMGVGGDSVDHLLEIVLDAGRPPRARCGRFHADDKETTLCEDSVTLDELQDMHARPELTPWSSDNRAGVAGTLHRVARMVSPHTGQVYGLTCRVGREQVGAAAPIGDQLKTGLSILLLGPPGSGKTTLLRDASRAQSDDHGRRVIVVDTSGEIAGGSAVAHPAIGANARRMMVGRRADQHEVMLEAVQNHTPEVVIVDEISTAAEAHAAGSISQRGVSIIATAHGRTLKQLIRNPELNLLVGGIESAILGDAQAKMREDKKKVIQQRQGRPVFDVVVELQPTGPWLVHMDVAGSVDRLLLDQPPVLEQQQTKTDLRAERAEEEPDLVENFGDGDVLPLQRQITIDLRAKRAEEEPDLVDSFDNGDVLPLQRRLSQESLDAIANGSAYMLSFDGSSTAKCSAAAAVLAQLPRRIPGPAAVSLARLLARKAKLRVWHLYVPVESNADRMEAAALLMGVQCLRAFLHGLQPRPTAVLVQGDSKIVISTVCRLFSNRTGCAGVSPVQDKTLDTLCHMVARELEQLPVEVQMLWMPRRFNSTADAQAQRAREDKLYSALLREGIVNHLALAAKPLEDQPLGSPSLWRACSDGDMAHLDDLLVTGLDPDVVVHDGEPLLEWLIERFVIQSGVAHRSTVQDVIQALVKRKPNFSSIGRRGTCFHALVSFWGESTKFDGVGRRRRLRQRVRAIWGLLVSAGADPSALDARGCTARQLMREFDVEAEFDAWLGHERGLDVEEHSASENTSGSSA